MAKRHRAIEREAKKILTEAVPDLIFVLRRLLDADGLGYYIEGSGQIASQLYKTEKEIRAKHTIGRLILAVVETKGEAPPDTPIREELKLVSPITVGPKYNVQSSPPDNLGRDGPPGIRD